MENLRRGKEVKALFSLNHKIVAPALSFLPPHFAYKINNYTGMLGKSMRHGSFRFEYRQLAAGRDALVEYLNISPEAAGKVVEKFLLIENRALIENLWFARGKLDYLPGIINMDAVHEISEIIKQQGPMLLLSAHTAYYFAIPWAFHKIGTRIAYIMSNPREDRSSYILKKSGITSCDALSKLIPVIFTSDGDTTKRSTEWLSKGYSILMLIDLFTGENAGIKIKLFGKDVWLPSGCKWIYNKSKANAGMIFPYAADICKHYEVSFANIAAHPEDICLQKWADEFERIIKTFPESWLGWYLGRKGQ